MADADLIAALGARGMGKSAWVTQRLAKTKPKRLVIWDLMREHKAKLATTDQLHAQREEATREHLAQARSLWQRSRIPALALILLTTSS